LAAIGAACQSGKMTLQPQRWCLHYSRTARHSAYAITLTVSGVSGVFRIGQFSRLSAAYAVSAARAPRRGYPFRYEQIRSSLDLLLSQFCLCGSGIEISVERSLRRRQLLSRVELAKRSEIRSAPLEQAHLKSFSATGAAIGYCTLRRCARR
jgi:hypothetical protein